MKKLIFIISLSIAVTTITAQSWISSSRITSDSSIFELASAIDDAGNVFTFGHFEGTLGLPDGSTLDSYGGEGKRDYYLVKFLATGEVDWVNHYGSSAPDYLTGGLDVDAAGDVYITGGFQGDFYYTDTDFLTSSGTLDAFLVKVGTDGTVAWGENIGQGFFLQYSTTLTTDDSGDVLLAGSFRDSIVFNETVTLYSELFKFDAFYAKFSPANGDLLWAKQAKSLNGQQGFIWDIQPSSDSYYITGTLIDTIQVDTDTITSDHLKNNIFLAKTDLSGNVDWYREISGNGTDYSYSLTMDDEDNIYISSFFDSDTLFIQSDETTFIEEVVNMAGSDIYLCKYSSAGLLDWHKIIGGSGSNRVFALEFFDNMVHATGFITDTVWWGGIKLATTGYDDKDMFIGAIEKDGTFQSANSYSGFEKSTEEGRAVFQNGDKLYTVMRTDAQVLQLDKTYVSDGVHYYLVMGIIGCLPINVADPGTTDITGCYGDSTGTITIVPSGGFGAPWSYSIDDGASYSDQQFFNDLPAADYQIVVADKEGCTQSAAGITTLTQPDTLVVTVDSKIDIVVNLREFGPNDTIPGSILVHASGGVDASYTYTLIPGEISQDNGSFDEVIAWADSGKYVVAVNNAQNCGPTESDTIEINVVIGGVSIEGFGDQETKLYPNPTSGIVSLEMPYQEGEYSLEVLNMTGQLVMKRRIQSSGGFINESFDLSDQAKGLYMIRIDGKALPSAVMVK